MVKYDMEVMDFADFYFQNEFSKTLFYVVESSSLAS